MPRSVCCSLRKDELRDQTSINQTALKVMHAEGEVVELHYRLPSGISKAGRGDIDLLDHGEAAGFESGAHRLGAHKETRRPVGRPGHRKHWGTAGSLRYFVTREAPTRFQHPRHLASQSLLVGDVHGDGV